MPDHFLDTRGVRIRFRTAGTGPPVVFVHGWALDLDMWEPQFETLSDRFRVIAFDRRGFGLSTGSPDIGEDVRDLNALLDELSESAAAIVGMSQGARVALRFALALPARTTCIVLDGAPSERTPADAPDAEVPIAHYRELLRESGIDAVRREWSRHPLMQLHGRDAQATALLSAIVARYAGRDLSSTAPAPQTIAQLLPALHVPALVITGALDTAERRAAAAELAQALPAARRVEVPGAGHLPNLDDARGYAALLNRFMSQHVHGPDAYTPAERFVSRRNGQ
jgi:pimeloyl-ACP methyl ester carboxylesterase